MPSQMALVLTVQASLSSFGDFAVISTRLTGRWFASSRLKYCWSGRSRFWWSGVRHARFHGLSCSNG